MSLVTEGARAPQRLYEFALRTLAQSAKIVVPLALVVALLSPLILRLFGPEYVDGASMPPAAARALGDPERRDLDVPERGPGPAPDARGRGRHRGDVDQRDGALGPAARPVRAHRRRRRVARGPVGDRDRAAPHRAPGGLAAPRPAAPAAALRVHPQPRGRAAARPRARGRRVGSRPASPGPTPISGRSSSARGHDGRPRRAAVRPDRTRRAQPAPAPLRARRARPARRPGGWRASRPRCWRRRGRGPALVGRDPPRRLDARACGDRTGPRVGAARAGEAIRVLHTATATRDARRRSSPAPAWVDEPITRAAGRRPARRCARARTMPRSIGCRPSCATSSPAGC